METFFHKHSLYIALLLFVVSIFILANQVFAFGKPSGAGSDNPGFSEQNNPGNQHIPQQGDRPSGIPSPFPSGGEPSGIPQQAMFHMPAFVLNRLQGGKLQACQSIEKALTNRSTHLVDLVIQMEKTFNSIAQGVEQYYLTKVIPTGTNLPTYDSLVADITTKQNALTPLIVAAQSDVTTFSCTGNNPGALMTQYRTDMQAVLKGLQDYRTSIKNLIVAVRTLSSVSSSETPSITPSVSPTVSPTITPSETPTLTLTPSPKS
jgi:hypothetical protein